MFLKDPWFFGAFLVVARMPRLPNKLPWWSRGGHRAWLGRARGAKEEAGHGAGDAQALEEAPAAQAEALGSTWRLFCLLAMLCCHADVVVILGDDDNHENEDEDEEEVEEDDDEHDHHDHDYDHDHDHDDGDDDDDDDHDDDDDDDGEDEK